MYKYLLAKIDMCILSIRPETIKLCRGQDGRIRITVPPKLSGEPTDAILVKLIFKEVRIVSQEQELTIVVNPNPKNCDAWWIGRDGAGVMMMIGAPRNEK